MKTTFSRTFFPAVLILLAALLTVGFAFQLLIKDYLQKQMVGQLEGEAATVAQLASAYYTDPTLPDQDFYLYLTMANEATGADTVICDSKGRLVLCADAPMGCKHRGMVLSGGYLQAVVSSGKLSYTGKIRGLYEERRYVVAMPFYNERSNSLLGMVLVSAPVSTALGVLDRMSDIYLLVSGFVVLAALLVISFLTRKLSAPLRGMARAANAFGHGQLAARVPVDPASPQEVQDLALAFNNMAASLEKSEYQRQEFVANVSHELKTPMTTIGGYVDGVLDGTIPPEKQRQYLTVVSQETRRLSRLVRSMLEISRLQQGIPEEKKTRFEVSECVGQVLITFEQKITEKGLDVQVQMPDHPVYTRADRDAITQVVYNLVDNGVKFCEEQGVFGVQIRQQGEKICVSVSNTGKTIPPEELPLVFDRFHKLDKSRSENRDGWGLGLYIVKTLICSHGEDVSVSSKDGRTEFTFTLPFVN